MLTQKQVLKKSAQAPVDLSFLWPEVKNPAAQRCLALAYNAMPPLNRDPYITSSDLPHRLRRVYSTLQASGLAHALASIPCGPADLSATLTDPLSRRIAAQVPSHFDGIFQHVFDNLFAYAGGRTPGDSRLEKVAVWFKRPPGTLLYSIINCLVFGGVFFWVLPSIYSEHSPAWYSTLWAPGIVTLVILYEKISQPIRKPSDSEAITLFLYLKEEYTRGAAQ